MFAGNALSVSSTRLRMLFMFAYVGYVPSSLGFLPCVCTISHINCFPFKPAIISSSSISSPSLIPKATSQILDSFQIVVAKSQVSSKFVPDWSVHVILTCFGRPLGTALISVIVNVCSPSGTNLKPLLKLNLTDYFGEKRCFLIGVER